MVENGGVWWDTASVWDQQTQQSTLDSNLQDTQTQDFRSARQRQRLIVSSLEVFAYGDRGEAFLLSCLQSLKVLFCIYGCVSGS